MESKKDKVKMEDIVSKDRGTLIGDSSNKELTREELSILIQVLNQPRQQDLQTAQKLIMLSNKLSAMIEDSEN